MRADSGAAFAVDVAGEERLVVVQEMDRRREGEAAAAAEAVRQAVAEAHEVQVHEVVLVRMGSIPKTSSGKIQRHASRAAWLAGELAVVGRSAVGAGTEGADEAVAFQSGLSREALLALPPAERGPALEFWLRLEAARSLGVAPWRLAADRPLTAAGLDSLAAVEIRARAEAVLGTAPSLAALLEGATLGELAAEILTGLETPALAALPGEPVASGEETGEHPLSHGQQALWFLHRLAPQSLAYHLAGAARVRGAVDVAALERAVEALVERHPALRTTFAEGIAGPVQRVHERLAPEVGIAASLDDAWRPFDLETGPLLRVGLVRDPEGEILFLAVHHLIADFASLAVMARDLGALYAHEVGRPAAVLPPLALRYTDWARWQAERLAGPWGESLWSWWRETLAPGGTEPPRLDLPTDRPWPAVQTWAGDARSFQLDAVTGEVNALAHRQGATPFMALLAAFEAVLARYTGQDDLLIGSPTAGRSAATAGMVGYFVNPVALRTDFGGGPSFTAALAEVRRVVLGAFEHQDLPFALLAERLQPRRDPSRSPLFDVVFAFERARGAGADLGGFALGMAGSRLALGGLELESLDLPPAGSPFALALVIAEIEGGLGASLRFNPDLFDAATVERLAGHYAALLAGALAAPGRLLSELPLLTAAEEWQVLGDWNRTAASYAWKVPVHRLVEERAAAAPGAPAVDGLTYRELDERANRLAGWLLANGLTPETRVGVLMERSPEMVVSLLAVLKAGGAYVPLDPAHPAERLAWQLADAWGDGSVQLLLTQSRLAASLSNLVSLDARILSVDAEPDTGGANPGIQVLPDQAAYVVYTSGSTGRPKGVVIAHGALANLVSWHRRTYAVTPADRASQVAGPGFDAAVWEIWPYLAAGASLHVPEEEVRASPRRLVAWLAEQAISIAFLPTPLAEAALAEDWPSDIPLRALLTGGDRLHRGPRPGLPFTLYNHYGPTESTVVATCIPVSPEDQSPPIGRPIDNTRAYVLDRHLRPLPAGVPGELALGGESLARGYLNRPELTAERFVPDPFGEAPDARLYRTGDLVRWAPRAQDASLEFLGRIDHQVKVRGVRIELGEIEAVLGEHPGVRQAAVVVRQETGETHLAAYVVPRVAFADLAGELRAHLRGRLPEAMIPTAWMTLEALPLTPNGKVDRQSLPAPSFKPEAEGGAPRTPAEALLAGIWDEVLGTPGSGAFDDFFASGGHSLLAARVASRASAAFGVEVPLSLIFEAPTPAALAAAIEALRVAGRGAEAPPLVPAPPAARERGLPLSFAQERLWFLDRLEPGAATYNIAGGLWLEGPLDVAALAAVLAEVTRRHEALRSRFEERFEGMAGSLVQRALPPPAAALPMVDLSRLAAATSEVDRLVSAEAKQPFDLAQGPLLRAVLLRLGAEEHVLVAAMHHIVSDGWSLGLLLREISVLYGAAIAGRPSPLAELPVQVGDFAWWERQWLTGEALEVRLEAARQRLAGAPLVLDLPADLPRPATRSSRGAREPLALSPGDFRGSGGPRAPGGSHAVHGPACRL